MVHVIAIRSQAIFLMVVGVTGNSLERGDALNVLRLGGRLLVQHVGGLRWRGRGGTHGGPR